MHISGLARGVGAVVVLCAATLAFAGDPERGADLFRVEPMPYVAPVERFLERPTKPRVIDKKFVALHALAMGLTIADIERTQSCLGNRTCRELNPLSPVSRTGMYAVNVPLNAGLMYLSYRLKASGKRTWWIVPAVISGAHGVGVGFEF
ncbi:MAG TPA: hypothetical protein VN577_06280 [Terriglobales bacterium]|nr:hypothetical protein [Terriglobales bacterium]